MSYKDREIPQWSSLYAPRRRPNIYNSKAKPHKVIFTNSTAMNCKCAGFVKIVFFLSIVTLLASD